MNLLEQLAITVLLVAIQNPQASRKLFPAIAKVQRKAEILEKLDPNYAAEIDRQRRKEGLP